MDRRNKQKQGKTQENNKEEFLLPLVVFIIFYIIIYVMVDSFFINLPVVFKIIISFLILFGMMITPLVNK
jgi:flagellar biosynthesis component FlhA